MNQDYKAVFRELRYEVTKVAFLNAFLSAAILFFAANIFCTIFKISFWYSLVPAALTFIFLFTRMMRRYTLRRIEEGNPEVREILRTANDNSGKSSLMVHALFLELMQKLETVSAGVFISMKSTTTKLFIIALLAFTPLLIVNYAPILITGNPIEAFNWDRTFEGAREALAPVTPIADAGGRDLLGDQDIIALGNERLDITASSSQGGVDFTNTGDATGRRSSYNDYPDQVDVEQTTAGTGGSVEDADLINSYSCRRTGTCPPGTQ